VLAHADDIARLKEYIGFANAYFKGTELRLLPLFTDAAVLGYFFGFQVAKGLAGTTIKAHVSVIHKVLEWAVAEVSKLSTVLVYLREQWLSRTCAPSRITCATGPRRRAALIQHRGHQGVEHQHWTGCVARPAAEGSRPHSAEGGEQVAGSSSHVGTRREGASQRCA
jgi:hypothetical protein